MMKCDELARRISAGETFTPWKRMEIRIHLLMCRACARYVRQLGTLKRAIRRLAAATDPKSSVPSEAEIIRKHVR